MSYLLKTRVGRPHAVSPCLDFIHKKNARMQIPIQLVTFRQVSGPASQSEGLPGDITCQGKISSTRVGMITHRRTDSALHKESG